MQETPVSILLGAAGCRVFASAPPWLPYSCSSSQRMPKRPPLPRTTTVDELNSIDARGGKLQGGPSCAHFR